MYIELSIVPEHQRDDRTLKCAVCGRKFVVGKVVSHACSSNGKLLFGEVCAKCIEGGPEEMAEELQAQAEYCRAEAAEVEKVAAESITAPPVGELRMLETIAAP